MKKRFNSSIGRTIRLEQDVDKIVRDSELDISNLVEAGLISLAKNPGTRRDKLLQEAIRVVEDRITYFTECLSELNQIKNSPTNIIPQTGNSDTFVFLPEKPQEKKYYNPEVRYYLKHIKTRERRELNGKEYEALEDKENWRPEDE